MKTENKSCRSREHQRITQLRVVVAQTSKKGRGIIVDSYLFSSMWRRRRLSIKASLRKTTTTTVLPSSSTCSIVIMLMALLGRCCRPSHAFVLSLSQRQRTSSSHILHKLLTTTTTSTKISRRTAGGTIMNSANDDNDDYDHEFDVIVVGGGHAGCEAAAAAARTGARTALITQRMDTIGELSCNPSIGGIGKGHLVREIDALDGLMGTVADTAGIHFRVLNRRKGPAVRGPRAQMDRDLYKHAMQTTLLESEKYSKDLVVIEASVQDLLLDESSKSLESLAPFSTLGAAVTRTSATPTGLLGLETSSLSEEQRSPMQQKMIESSVYGLNRKARIRGVQVEMTKTTDNEGGTTTTTTTSTREIMGRAVVLTTGTFLRGVLMLGHERYAGGRHLRDSEFVEAPTIGLAKTLEKFAFPLGRLKTGTPARVDGRTIDWDILIRQPSENPAQAFSHLLQFDGLQPPNVAAGRLIDCYQTATNEETHKLVMEYEHTLPMYDGMDGKGNGPRYCPSIYKKVQRFPDRAGHNCFLEPEGLNTDIVYPNGMSGPYPPEIQQLILRTMKGMGGVEIVRPGYDVEYDFVNPTCLTHTLESKTIGGLYLAGQICGTTGYEEAGAQGIVAGANAGRAAVAASCGSSKDAPVPFVIGRDEGYIGVLIDDLVTRGTTEPYRMFTSRAEYRITLRADNADLRLTRKGAQHGLLPLDGDRMAALEAREWLLDDRLQQLRDFELKVTEWSARGGNELMGGAQLSKKKGQKKTAEEVLMMPHVTLQDVEEIMMNVNQVKSSKVNTDVVDDDDDTDDESVETMMVPTTPCPPSVFDTVEAVVKYQSYVRRQYKDMESWRKAQGLRIPPDVLYDRQNLPTLSLEELEKLNTVRPNTFAEASQISGVTPQSLVYLYHHVQRRNRNRDKSKQAMQ